MALSQFAIMQKWNQRKSLRLLHFLRFCTALKLGQPAGNMFSTLSKLVFFEFFSVCAQWVMVRVRVRVSVRVRVRARVRVGVRVCMQDTFARATHSA